MDTIRYAPAQEIPIRHTADVIVLGGGPGGLGAAVMAARAGAKTLLIERYGYLGGMASAGEVQPFMHNHAHGICLDKPVYVEWVNRMHTYLPASLREKVENPQEVHGGFDRIISKDMAMLAAEDLCLEGYLREI
jgi:flavin-dependent dehydrogenase